MSCGQACEPGFLAAANLLIRPCHSWVGCEQPTPQDDGRTNVSARFVW
jgi:hypothetical protein